MRKAEPERYKVEERESSESRCETVAWWSGEAEDRVKGDMRGERDVIRFVAILQQAPQKGISHRHAAPAVMTWKQPEAPHSSPSATTHPRSGLLQNLSTTGRLSCVQVGSKCTHQTFTGLQDLAKTILLLSIH